MSLWCEGDGGECAECHVFDFLPSLCPGCKRIFCWEHILSHHVFESESKLENAYLSNAFTGCISPGMSPAVERRPTNDIQDFSVPESSRPWCTLGRETPPPHIIISGAAQERTREREGTRMDHVDALTRDSFHSCLPTTCDAPTSFSVEPLPPLSLKRAPCSDDTCQGYAGGAARRRTRFSGWCHEPHSFWLRLPSSTLHCPLRLETDASHHLFSTRIGIPILFSASLEEIFLDETTPQGRSTGPRTENTAVESNAADTIGKQNEEETGEEATSRRERRKDSFDACSFPHGPSLAALTSRFIFSICSWDVATYYSLGRAIESCLEAVWTDAAQLSGTLYWATIQDSTARVEEDHLDDKSSTSCTTCYSSGSGRDQHKRALKNRRSVSDGEKPAIKAEREEDAHTEALRNADGHYPNRKFEALLPEKKRSDRAEEEPYSSARKKWPAFHLLPLANSLLIQDVVKMRNDDTSSTSGSFLLLHIGTKRSGTAGNGGRGSTDGKEPVGSECPTSLPVCQRCLSQELSEALFSSRWEEGPLRTCNANGMPFRTSTCFSTRTRDASSGPVSPFMGCDAEAAYAACVHCFRRDPRVQAIRVRCLLQHKKLMKIETLRTKHAPSVHESPSISVEVEGNTHPAISFSSSCFPRMLTELEQSGLETKVVEDRGNRRAFRKGEDNKTVLHELEPPGVGNGCLSVAPLPHETKASELRVVSSLPSGLTTPPPLPSTEIRAESKPTKTYWPFVTPPPLHSFAFHTTKLQPLRCEGLGLRDAPGSTTIRVPVFIEDAILGVSSAILPVHVLIGSSWTNGKAGQLVKDTLLLYIRRVCSSLSPTDEGLRLIRSKYELFAFLRRNKKTPSAILPSARREGQAEEDKEDKVPQYPCLSSPLWSPQPLLLQNGDCLFFGLPEDYARERRFQGANDEENNKGDSLSDTTSKEKGVLHAKNLQHQFPQIPRALVEEVKRMDHYTTRSEKQQLKKDLLSKCYIM